MEVILTFEEFCGEEGEFSTDQGAAFAGIFIQVGCSHIGHMFDTGLMSL